MYRYLQMLNALVFLSSSSFYIIGEEEINEKSVQILYTPNISIIKHDFSTKKKKKEKTISNKKIVEFSKSIPTLIIPNKINDLASQLID